MPTNSQRENRKPMTIPELLIEPDVLDTTKSTSPVMPDRESLFDTASTRTAATHTTNTRTTSAQNAAAPAHDPGDLMTPGEVAQAFGVKTQTVHRWGSSGRLTIAGRTSGGHSRYSRAEVTALTQPQNERPKT
jgi:hypothetical protein